jgi:hypothetical protein
VTVCCYVCVSIIMVYKNLDQLCKISLKSLLRDVKLKYNNNNNTTVRHDNKVGPLYF